jgi:peptide/nickel transport system substrate-binding protein
MGHKTSLILTATLIVVSLLLTQCAPAATPAPAPTQAPVATAAPATQAPAPTEAPAATMAPAPTEAAAMVEQRILRESEANPPNIDPAVGSDFSSSTALANLYDTLVFPNTKGGVDPWLAENWDTSADGLTWTFHLRNGVKFHNGDMLKASDVVFSANRIMTIGEGFGYLFVKVISSVTAPDDSTVVFTLSKPNGLFLLSLIRLYVLNEKEVMANIATPGSYGDLGDYGKKYLLTHDAGSGPYKVKEFKLEESLTMEKNNDWWGTFVDNAPDEYVIIGTTETATIRTLVAKRELEITDQWQTVQALKALQQIEGVKVAALPSLTEFYYMMNTQKAPTDDLHCRKAISYAFDYNAAVGLEWPGTQQSVGPVPASLAGHKDVFVFHRDLDQAKAELAQCKYASDIAKYPVTVHWAAEVPDEEKFALLFQANMADIGIKVDVVGTPWLSMVDQAAKADTSPNINTIYVSADLPEAGSILKLRYHSDAHGTWAQNEWLDDKELDTLIETSLETIDAQKRYQMYGEIQDYLMNLVPSLFLYDQVEKHAYQAAYIDWPAARGEVIPVIGYQILASRIQVYPEKRAALVQ